MLDLDIVGRHRDHLPFPMPGHPVAYKGFEQCSLLLSRAPKNTGETTELKAQDVGKIAGLSISSTMQDIPRLSTLTFSQR